MILMQNIDPFIPTGNIKDARSFGISNHDIDFVNNAI